MISDSAINVAGVTHWYGRTHALAGVSLEVRRGELTGLLGPNGSGKTTLFRLLATLIPIRSGRIVILGHDVAESPEAIRSRLGVTFQAPSLDTRLTVFENLYCHGRLFGIRRSLLKERITDALSRLELSDRRSTRVDELSGGLRRRVELAKCLLHQPEILLLDEPGSGLDLLARKRFWGIVNDIRDEFGTTVFVSTHLMDEADLCDRLFLFNEGRLVTSGSPSELRQRVKGERLTIHLRDTEPSPVIQKILGAPAGVQGNTLTFRHTDAASKVSELLAQAGDDIHSVEVAHSTLDDVFLDATGRSLEE